MDINGKTALVLGGAGLVGRAICHELILEGAGAILVGGLTAQEAIESITIVPARLYGVEDRIPFACRAPVPRPRPIKGSTVDENAGIIERGEVGSRDRSPRFQAGRHDAEDGSADGGPWQITGHTY